MTPAGSVAAETTSSPAPALIVRLSRVPSVLSMMTRAGSPITARSLPTPTTWIASAAPVPATRHRVGLAVALIEAGDAREIDVDLDRIRSGEVVHE